MPEFVQSIEVIVVDDCSTDNSAILAEGFKAENIHLKVVRLQVNSGKGEAVAAGIRASSGDTLAIQDADLELDPADLPALVEMIHREELDLVSGTRFRTGRRYPVHAKLAAGANRLFSLAASLITCRKVTDITCGHKVFRRDLYDRLNLTERRFGFETELILKVSAGSKCQVR